MRFESQFGLGELVCTKQGFRDDLVKPDLLLEVIGITFQVDGGQTIVCRLPDGTASGFMVTELVGDPAFNQETGGY